MTKKKTVDNLLTKKPVIHKDRWGLSIDVKHSQVIVKCLKFFGQMAIGKFTVINEIIPKKKPNILPLNYRELLILRNKFFPELNRFKSPFKRVAKYRNSEKFIEIERVNEIYSLSNNQAKKIIETEHLNPLKAIPALKDSFLIYKRIIKKTPPMELTITESEGYTINNCLELYYRLAMGQFDFVLDGLVPIEKWLKLGIDRYSDYGYTDLRLRLFPELPGLTCYHAIRSNKIPKEAQIACDIYQIIRHRLSWDRVGNPEKRDWSTMGGVNFDEPHNISDYPFCKIRKIGS